MLDRLANTILNMLRSSSLESVLKKGIAFGNVYRFFAPARVHTARTNLRIAFPEWSEDRREEVLKASFEHLGRSLAEFLWMGQLPEEELQNWVRVEGIEHLEPFLHGAQGKHRGVVAMTAHLGNWELLGRAMSAHGYPLSIVHRKRDKAWVESLVAHCRISPETEFLTRGNAARGALRALRSGRILAMPYDQNCSRKEGVFVPFFGRLAACRVAPIRIAKKTGSPIIPVFIEREKDGLHHVCHVRPPLELSSADTEQAILKDVRQMNRVIEDEIRRIPEQWIWIHRRWKTQPVGEPRPPYTVSWRWV